MKKRSIPIITIILIGITFNSCGVFLQKTGEFMYNLKNNKQLTNNRQHSLGSHGKQQLLFPLVHLILCYKYMYLLSNLFLDYTYNIFSYRNFYRTLKN
jgi:hypothetical protein